MALFLNTSNLYPEVDYQAMMSQMSHHSHPRRKLKEMQNKAQLIRLKKGFYVLSKDLIEKEYSPEIVANLLYGPSYLSLEYALSYYALIPERVMTYTSVTTAKNKSYSTAIGHFSYQHLAMSIYPLCISLKRTLDSRTYLMATPEKALMDLFTLKFSHSALPERNDVRTALEDDLRINISNSREIFSRQRLQFIKPFYKNRRWNKLAIDWLLEEL